LNSFSTAIQKPVSASLEVHFNKCFFNPLIRFQTHDSVQRFDRFPVGIGKFIIVFDWVVPGVSNKFSLRWPLDNVRKLAGCLSLQVNDSEAASATPPSERGDGHSADD
jgi:hypothetical protein